VTLGGRSIPLTLRNASEREASARVLLQALKRTPADDRRATVEGLVGQLPVPAGTAPSPARYAFMDWPEAKALADSGLVEMGSHTVNHPILAQVPEEESRREIAESKADIESRLGRPCRLFAYPNGSAADFSERDRSLVRAAGYLGAVSQIAGLNSAGTDPYACRRVNIGLGHTPELFAANACGLWPVLQRLLARH
jgi:peptidoglycan/xylan/chitin deacetylase (PgdA/CDA1 family)